MREAKAQSENTVDTILQVGQVVAGKYRVDYLAGRGGMAAVWAGTNERTGKRVALKVILQSMAATNDAQHLFHSEALAASRVNHPNVVTIFDVIDHEGMTCIVMEFLDGEPLSSYIARKGALSVSEATALLLPAMRGVAAAHAQDVIHRDLKPQNIFVCIGPDGRVVTSKVLDFGISVVLERVIGAKAGAVPGLHLGTPAYMSPEHLSGVTRVDERVDVYGFGLLLYEALTGQMPFPGEPSTELFKRVLSELPTPVTKLRPDLPPGLVRIIDVAIAKDPDHRYSDLNLMVTALEEELLLTSSLHHLVTPIAGVPAHIFREAMGGSSAVQAILRNEPSGQYKETKILYGFSLEKQHDGSPAGASGAANGGAKAGRSAPPAGRETVVLRFRPGQSLLRIRSLPAFQDWLKVVFLPWLRSVLHRRWTLVGAGIAVALIFTVWGIARGPGRNQVVLSASATTVAQPEPAQLAPLPSISPIIVPTEAPDPATLAAGAPGGLAASGQPKATPEVTIDEHAAPPLIPSPRSRAAVQGLTKTSPQGHSGQSSAKAEGADRLSRDRAARKIGRPRSGSLSEDDF
ncbi:MAG TPA: protein kinase [Polyangia bacterium]